jgi:hypothetical protein
MVLNMADNTNVKITKRLSVSRIDLAPFVVSANEAFPFAPSPLGEMNPTPDTNSPRVVRFMVVTALVEDQCLTHSEIVSRPPPKEWYRC